MDPGNNEDGSLFSAAVENGANIQPATIALEDALQRQSEWLRITLASIGDGVISTDADSRVTFLNGVAETMTGWTQAEASSQPLSDVFRIIDEQSGLPAENPASRAIRAGSIVGLMGRTILVAKDGVRRPIEDSTAPMRDRQGSIVGTVLVFRDITQHRQAEAERERLLRELAAGQERLAEVFLRAPSFMVILRGPDHVFELANERYYELVGKRDIIGRPLREALPEIAGQGFCDLLDGVYRTGQAYASNDMKVVVQRYPSGPLEERYVDFVYQPLRNPDGTVSGILAQGVDLTERKRAEATLRQRDVRLQLLLENATDFAVILTDPAGVVLEWQGGAEAITGWTPEEMIGHPASIIFFPDELLAGAAEAEMNKAAATGRAEDKRWHMKKDGSAFFADGVMVSLRDPSGKLYGFGKVMRDATERKRADEALARDALLLANVRDSVIVTDLAGFINYWNEGATRLFGWTAEEMLGRNYADRFPESLRARIHGQIHELAVGTEWASEYEDFRKDGSRVWIDARVSRVNDEEGRPVGLLGLAHDITDRKSAEQALLQADRRKDEFLAVLAHELRNPLAPLRNGLQVMRLAAADPVAVARSRDMMERQLSHMVRLIDDLLDISRISQNKMELRRRQVLLADVVVNSVEIARPLIEAAGHTLTVALPPEPISLDADLTRLSQVFGNLLANSAKYTARGGRIWLEAELRDDRVHICVRDTGIGIPSTDLARVFDMFSQVDRSIERSTGGLGIGLALVKGLVEMHGGTVSAASDGPDKGSTFTVQLPTSVIPIAKLEHSVSRVSDADRGRKRRILVVDDNRDSAASLASLLSLLGSDVRTAHDGVEAIEAADAFRPEVILMDVGMPRLNGYEATRRIREQPWGRDITVIALTGWGQDRDRLQSQAAGCNGHLVKPVNVADLERLVDDAPSAAAT